LTSWLREAEPELDFVALRASSAPAISRATPVTGPEPVASSPITPSAAGFPRELVVRLEVPTELIDAIRELEEATIVPIYIPISVAQMAPQVPLQAPNHAPARATGEVICPKCGRPGKLYEYRRGRRSYVYVLHGRSKCSLGPADRVKVKRPSLAERALLHNAPRRRAGIPSLRELRPSPLAWSSVPPRTSFSG